MKVVNLLRLTNIHTYPVIIVYNLAVLSKKVINILFLALLFAVSLIPRAYQLESTEIFPDEITWTARSRESFLALKTGNPYYFKDGWWKTNSDTEAINLPTTIISGASIFFLAKNQPTHYSLNLFPDYIAARIPIVIINSLFIVLFYFISRKVTHNQTAAFLGSFMLALDPIYLGLSRWVLSDTLLAVWIFLSLSSYLFVKKNAFSILLAASFLSLAFLTKPTAILLLVVFLVYCVSNKLAYSPLKYLITLLVFTLLTHLLWLGTTGVIGWEILEYLLRQSQLAQKPFTTFFVGEITTNPPFYYYIYQLVVRLPLLALVGLVGFVLHKKLKLPSKKIVLSILLFIFLYLLAMSLSTKKLGIRYVFPVIPWLYLFASLPLATIATKLNKKVKLLYFLLIGVYELSMAIHYFPNYSLYYNQLIGGPANAQKYDLPGLCMGARDSVFFLEKNYSARSVAYMGCAKTVIPYYSGVSITTNWEKERFVIIEESFRILSPDEPAVLYFSNQEPVHINSWRGIVLARVYLNRDADL